MLRLHPTQPDSLWNMVLPEGLALLPPDLRRIDELLSEEGLLHPFISHWRRHTPRGLADGRPTIPMASYVRLMVLRHRYGWGYATLVREVADSLHLRRFCLIPLGASVPDESTVRKLTRRLGAEVVTELTRGIIRATCRERRFRARAIRVDSTVVEADIRYPTDVGLAAQAVAAITRAARKVSEALPRTTRRVRDRSRAVGRRVRELGRSLRRRTGEAASAVQRLTEEAAGIVAREIRDATQLMGEAEAAARRTRGRARRAACRAIARLREVIALAGRVCEQVRLRFAGERIPDRLVSFADPQARPVRKGKLASPTQFGYVAQLAEITASTRRGARGLLLPPPLRAGSTHEDTLLPRTVAELEALGITLREASFDAGFTAGRTTEAMQTLGAEVFISGSGTNPGSQRTRRRRARYRVGAEGRIAHLKREYGAGRARLRGTEGARIHEGWAVFAYDVDTTAAIPKRARPARQAAST